MNKIYWICRAIYVLSWMAIVGASFIVRGLDREAAVGAFIGISFPCAAIGLVAALPLVLRRLK